MNKLSGRIYYIMFTGIIETIGHIKRIVHKRTNQIYIDTALECKAGDRIAVQGVCLTVTQLEKKGLWVETMPQTSLSTTLDRTKVSDPVNLERALAIGGRIGGHFVLGHVDEIGKFIRKKSNEYFFQYDAANYRYLVSKGSVAINGVSLTIADISKQIFSVNLIPYTLNTTTLGMLKPGSIVNLEYDYLAKILVARQK